MIKKRRIPFHRQEGAREKTENRQDVSNVIYGPFCGEWSKKVKVSFTLHYYNQRLVLVTRSGNIEHWKEYFQN
jgi:hypothetical protein